MVSISRSYVWACVIVAVVLLFVASIIAYLKPVVSYEASIYTATPLVFWILLSVSFLIGIGLCLVGKVGGFVVLLSANLALLSLFVIRGYAFWGMHGDAGLHLGWIQNIIATGKTDVGNYYPVMHYTTAWLSELTGFTPLLLCKILPVIWAAFYFVFIYLSARLLLTKRQALFVSLLGMPILDNYYLIAAPSVLSNLMLPVAFYIMLKKRQSWQYKVAFIVVVAIYTGLHPIAWGALVILFIVLEYVCSIGKYRYALSVVLVLICGLVWLASFHIWDVGIRSIFSKVATVGILQEVVMVIDSASVRGLGRIDIFIQMLKLYGYLLLYGSLALIALWYVWKAKNKLMLGICATVAIYLLLILILRMTSIAFDPMRLQFAMTFLLVYPAGYGLYIVWHKYIWAKVPLILLLCLVFSNGIMSLYASPYILQSSLQNTDGEINGYHWLIDNKNPELYSGGWYYAPWTFASVFLTAKQVVERPDLNPYHMVSVPFHLGYDRQNSIGELDKFDWYLVITERMRRTYKDTYAWLGEDRLTDGDFAKLSVDKYAKLLYDKDGFSVYYITSCWWDGKYRATRNW